MESNNTNDGETAFWITRTIGAVDSTARLGTGATSVNAACAMYSTQLSGLVHASSWAVIRSNEAFEIDMTATGVYGGDPATVLPVSGILVLRLAPSASRSN